MKETERQIALGVERIPWKRAVAEWTPVVQQSIKPRSYQRYKFSLRALRPFLDDKHLDEIDRKLISAIAHRKGVSNTTRRRDLTALSSVLRFAVSRGWIENNPAREWDRGTIRERRDPIVLPAPEDVAAVIAEAPGNFSRMIEFARYTGMRLEECASLRRHQVRVQDCAVQLYDTKGRPRSVPLDVRAVGTLSGTPAHVASDRVFWHGETGERYRNVSSQFGRIMRQCVRKKTVGRPFRFHDLRHLYAVEYLREGGSIYTLQQILGHRSIKTTELYLEYLTPDEQMRAKFGSAQNPAQR